jgi:hypothetical protein
MISTVTASVVSTIIITAITTTAAMGPAQESKENKLFVSDLNTELWYVF